MAEMLRQGSEGRPLANAMRDARHAVSRWTWVSGQLLHRDGLAVANLGARKVDTLVLPATIVR
jgi:hypothetical protein